jgi:mRNA interferase MazF
MKRGDIYFANLDPTVGTEIKKKRPVLIVSNNANNHMSETITVVPLTSSNIKKIYHFEVLIETQDAGLTKPSKAQCHQIRTISKSRIQNLKIGSANNLIMLKINSAMKIHLDII